MSTLHRVCQKLNWTLKKKAQRPIERNEAVRWQFLAQMQQRLGQNGTYRTLLAKSVCSVLSRRGPRNAGQAAPDPYVISLTKRPSRGGACLAQIAKSSASRGQNQRVLTSPTESYRACPLDPHKVVLFDETGTRLGMTPARARSPKGERAHSPERRNTGTNHTLLSVVSLNGVLPDLLLEGGVNRLSFEFYLEHLLLPQMQPGSNPADSPHGAGWPAGRTGPIGAALSKTVPSCPRHMLDGYSTHLGGRVQKLVETQGCTLMYFLGYSPDPDGLTKNMRMRLYRANSSV